MSIAGDFSKSISEFLAAVAIDLELVPLALHITAIQGAFEKGVALYLETDLEVLCLPIRAMSEAFYFGLNADSVDALQAQWREFASEIQYTLDRLAQSRPPEKKIEISRFDKRDWYTEERDVTAATLQRLHCRLRQLQASADMSPLLKTRLMQRIAELEDSAEKCSKALARLSPGSDRNRRPQARRP